MALAISRATRVARVEVTPRGNLSSSVTTFWFLAFTSHHPLALRASL